MTTLSPAAQAVLDAFGSARDGEYIDGVWVVNERTMIAAALRAATDQVAPACSVATRGGYPAGANNERIVIRDRLLIIATELEA